MISGLHAIIYSRQAEALREFLKDILKLPAVDAGGGWLIYAAPPTELAVHPDQTSHHELYLMCEDVRTTTAELKTKGVSIATPITDRGWGLVTRLRLPSGDEIGLYQPKHPTALGLTSAKQRPAKSKSRKRLPAAKKHVPNKLIEKTRSLH